MLSKIINKFNIICASIWIRCIALSRGSWISFSAKLHIHPGGTLLVGHGVRVLHGVVLSVLPGALLELKDGCILNHGVVIYCASRIEIGSKSRIAHYCSVIDHDYDIRNTSSSFDAPKISAPIVMGANVWLGANVVVLKGVTIGSKCIIGAHTLVNKSISEGKVAFCQSNSHLVVRDTTERPG